jgi:Zn-dependent protease with chaperone function
VSVETAARPDGWVGRRIALVVFAGLWIVAAWLLWRTSVPSLHLSGFDEHRFFTSRELSRARDYERGLHVIFLLSLVASLATLAVLVWILPRSVRAIGLGRVGTAVIVGMVVLTASWAASLPFSVAGLWWQHHWDLGPFDVAAWFDAQWASLLVNAVFALATIVLLVALAVRFRRYWWIPGAAVFVALAFVLVLLSGWLAGAGTSSLDDHPIVQEDVRQIARAEGVDPPVSVEKVSDWTDQANAFATGFGPSTHVVLWDTLLDGRFSNGEIRVVIAHEFGHVKHRHILKGLAWYALIGFPALFVVAEVTRRRGGLRDPANLPLAVLVIAVFSLLAAPLQTEISRRYEAEADWRALETTRDPASMRRLFERFQETSLQDPNPPLWAYLWLENHPTLMQRIAMAERFEERKGEG